MSVSARWRIESGAIEGNNLLVSLMKSDENLDRQELTTIERGEQQRRRKEINEMSHPQTKHSNGPKRSQREMKRRAFRAPAANIPSKTESTPAPILQLTPLDIGDHGGVGCRGSGMTPGSLIFRAVGENRDRAS